MKKQHILSFIALFVLSFILTFTILDITSDKQNSSDNRPQTEISTEQDSQQSSQNENSSQEEQSIQVDQPVQNDSSSQNEQSSQNSKPPVNNGGTSTEDSETSSSEASNSEATPPNENTTPSTPSSDSYEGISKAEFYANYKPATSHQDAISRSKHGLLSGSLEVPAQYAVDASYRPKENGKYIRNTSTYYMDNGNTYVVVDANGNEKMRIYKGGAYITLEEVAAYMYAFGGTDNSFPANYTSKKKTSPQNSIWGEYLRVNHSYFLGNTDKYPYEPELPNISGCGGALQYYEMDIGTTGTVTPSQTSGLYNNGSYIKRGAARLVYARQDLNRNGIYEINEVYVFYTHNHYNDFREYLNYYGGWGEMFGNETGGGVFDSKYQCNPTPYVPTAFREFLN